jgi:hypothetical protein
MQDDRERKTEGENPDRDVAIAQKRFDGDSPFR